MAVEILIIEDAQFMRSMHNSRAGQESNINRLTSLTKIKPHLSGMGKPCISNGHVLFFARTSP